MESGYNWDENVQLTGYYHKINPKQDHISPWKDLFCDNDQLAVHHHPTYNLNIYY